MRLILDLIRKADFSQDGNIYHKVNNDEKLKPGIVKKWTKIYKIRWYSIT